MIPEYMEKGNHHVSPPIQNYCPQFSHNFTEGCEPRHGIFYFSNALEMGKQNFFLSDLELFLRVTTADHFVLHTYLTKDLHSMFFLAQPTAFIWAWDRYHEWLG